MCCPAPNPYISRRLKEEKELEHEVKKVKAKTRKWSREQLVQEIAELQLARERAGSITSERVNRWP
jgi:hypothetical protein